MLSLLQGKHAASVLLTGLFGIEEKEWSACMQSNLEAESDVPAGPTKECLDLCSE